MQDANFEDVSYDACREKLRVVQGQMDKMLFRISRIPV
jgi:hypothetical protein